MKRYISIFLIILILLSLLTSCKKKDDTVELYYPLTEDFRSLDPQIATDTSSKLIAYNCYEGLVRVNENGDVVAAGALDWDVSADSITYTFHLRPDAMWYLTNTSKEELSDKDPAKSDLPVNFDARVTAKDFVFGMRRAVDPLTGSSDNKYLAAIKNGQDIIDGRKPVDELGVEAVNDYTLKITLDYADPDFLYYLTRLVAMPCNEQFFNACKGRYGLAMEYMLCNGVYMVYRWSPGAVIRLESNPRYTGASKALNDRVWVYYLEDAQTVPEKLKKGNYDAGYVSAFEKQNFNEKDGYGITARSDVLWGYWFNGNHPAFSVTQFRQAFAGTVDKSILTPPDYIQGETDRIFTNALSPVYDYNPQLIAYDEKAAEANYKAAMELSEDISASMTVTVLTCEDFADSVKKQIQIWQRVFGIDVKIQVEKRETAINMMFNGNYQIAFLPVNITASNTAEFYRTFMSDSDYNVTGYKNANYDSLINSLTNSMSDEEEYAVYKSCEQSLITYGVIVPAFTEASYFITGKDTSGVYSFSESEVYFRNGIAE